MQQCHLQGAALAEELHQSLAPALTAARQGVVQLLKGKQPPPPTPPLPPNLPPEPSDDVDSVELNIEAEVEPTLTDLVGKLRAAYQQKVPGKKLRVWWRWE